MPAAAFLLALFAAAPAAALEIATGSMLGPRYKQDRFYVRNSRGAKWAQTNEGASYRKKLRGSLAMLRVAQGLFDDEWLTERKFDAEANTGRLIAQLDVYKRHGIGGVVVGLQGADPGYAPEVNGVARGRSADLGRGSGALISAYEADGSLKPAWAARLERLIAETNRRGMVLGIILFQQYQDEALRSPEAVVAAARNAARFLVARDARNVIVDLADAWDAQGDSWDHRRFIPRNIDNLIRVVRQEFQDAEFSLPIGASTSAAMSYPISLARVCDVVLLQGDGRSPADKLARSRQLKEYDRAVLMIGDDNGGGADAAALSRDSAAAAAFLTHAAGWSFSPKRLTDRFPFVYAPAAAAAPAEGGGAASRRRAYFRAVLERIAALVLRKPPSTSPRKGE